MERSPFLVLILTGEKRPMMRWTNIYSITNVCTAKMYLTGFHVKSSTRNQGQLRCHLRMLPMLTLWLVAYAPISHAPWAYKGINLKKNRPLRRCPNTALLASSMKPNRSFHTSKVKNYQLAKTFGQLLAPPLHCLSYSFIPFSLTNHSLPSTPI